MLNSDSNQIGIALMNRFRKSNGKYESQSWLWFSYWQNPNCKLYTDQYDFGV